MSSKADMTTWIGFGEAAQAFVGDVGRSAQVFDIKTANASTRMAKLDEYARHGVVGHESLKEALQGTALILSLVTADQAKTVAIASAALLQHGALYCDFNSVAPATKRAAARHIEDAGGSYVDVAIMSPVIPGRLGAPLLLSGMDAERASRQLAAIGFSNVKVVSRRVGDAATIKLVRSIMVKGFEALTAECLVAAHVAGVADEVVASLEGQHPGWAAQAEYSLERMLSHGKRRAAEMEEAVEMLSSLGAPAQMTKATIQWQRELGSNATGPSPAGLTPKLAALTRGIAA